MPPEHDQLIAEALRSGAYQNSEEVIRQALELLHQRDARLAENRAKIEEGYAAAQRGELMDSDQVRAPMEEKKRAWVGAWKTAEEVVVGDTQTDLETTFHRLADEWRNETWFISSIKKRISHPAHLKIIGLGRPAIPLIIKEMRSSPDHWFFALEAITREDPAPNAENMH